MRAYTGQRTPAQATGGIEDLSIAFGQADRYTDVAIAALDDPNVQRRCPRGTRFIIAGHSLGGMIHFRDCRGSTASLSNSI